MNIFGLQITIVLATGLIGSAFAATAGASFTVIAPEDWDRAESVVSDMAQSWGTTWAAEEGHEVTYGVVEDVDEPGIFYFATKRDDATAGRQVSIFRYDSASYGFERLYRIDSVGDAAWYVVGYDNGKVVYAETRATYDPGACGEPLVAGVDGVDGAALYQLPDNFAESWNVGPSAYSTEQADVDEVRTRQTDCEAAGTGG